MFRNGMGMVFGIVGGAMALGIAGVMLGNTRAAKKRRMMRRAMKTVHNIGGVMQKLTSF